MKIGKLATPKFVNAGLEWGRKQLPTIMSVGAVVGLGATVYLALKAKPKADEILDKRKNCLDYLATMGFEADGTEEEITPEEAKKRTREINIECALDMAKVVWRPIVVGGVTIGLILGANRISMKRLASLGAAYEVATGDLKKYKEKTKEILGEKKESEIREAVAKDYVKEKYDYDPEIIETGKGNILYHEPYTGRWFHCSKTAIEAAVNKVNDATDATMDNFVPLNDFFTEINLDRADLANDVGFYSTNSKRMDVTYTWTEGPNGEHAVLLSYPVYQRYYKDSDCFEEPYNRHPW